MSDKSIVSMSMKRCIICGAEYEDGNLLIQREFNRTRDPMLDPKTLTGMGLCPEDQAHNDNGMIALIECKNPSPETGSLKAEDADRTGNIAHLKRDVMERITGGSFEETPMLFVELGVIDKIKAMFEEAQGEENSDG